MQKQGGFFGGRQRYQLFTAVKYLVYALLSLNVYLFLQEELLALEHTFVDGFDASQIIQVFSATIDTAAWVVLLLLFELETSALDDERIHGAVRWGLHGVRGICYVAIVYAFSGYCAELMMLYRVEALNPADACTFVGLDYALLLDLDDYAPLDAGNCLTLGAEAYRLQGFDILADGAVLESARRLAWTDVINSAAWILVCVVLEVEVRLQLRSQLTGGIKRITGYFKFSLYAILFAAAAYWGYAGSFLDFWDAALWLFAFIFIELNVFEWQWETSHEAGTAVPG